jgi:hypothetical protein
MQKKWFRDRGLGEDEMNKCGRNVRNREKEIQDNENKVHIYSLCYKVILFVPPHLELDFFCNIVCTYFQTSILHISREWKYEKMKIQKCCFCMVQ